ncbi:DUF4838 domain-containing protein [Candidatus Electrothrix sp.]|uniref:DUF4838 domain-containing protein n=2 Tax=Candidatus Electrothrix sp. TaxID=2170559 RepID=UPI004057144B
MNRKYLLIFHALLLGILIVFGTRSGWSEQSFAATKKKKGQSVQELVIADKGKTSAVIVVADNAGLNELLAAEDLVKYIGMMSGATPAIANTPETIAAALQGKHPVLLIGQEALKADKSLAAALQKPVTVQGLLRSDAIVLRRKDNRLYLAGSNDLSHYYAVIELLRRWGCRWYLPTEFGECIPKKPRLTIGELNYTYAPPFEIRSYWISWLGDRTGMEDFQRHNFMTLGKGDFPPTGHALGKYVRDLNKDIFRIPLTAPETAEHIVKQVEEKYAAGESFSLSMEDGVYESTYPGDKKLMKLQWDKYYLRWSMTDPFLELYNNVADTLQKKYPDSPAKIGFLAYTNMTIPPVQEMKAEKSLFCELAPIDIDPIHGMDSLQSPPRQEYKDFVYTWAEVMDGRLAIYDYDQGMLVWRDLPNPSHQAFVQDVQHYRKAGILGIHTESRNAIATTFLNLYLRGQLMWNPDVDIQAELAAFYPKFYGPAAEPMREYWEAIFQTWEQTIVTEHEYFLAPTIYTSGLLKTMKARMKEAETLLEPLRKKKSLSRNEQLYLDRIAFTRMSCDITTLYLAMVKAAASDIDYKKAVQLGEKALVIREKLTAMNGTFTTYKGMKVENKGYAWWPGEVRQYRELEQWVNGDKGKLVLKLPLEWAFRRDPKNIGVKKNFATEPVDLTFWQANRGTYTLDLLKDYPATEWEMLRTDLYMQAQGVRNPDRQSYTGYAWYRIEVDIPAEQVDKKLHLRFPGLFNECWLYVNGEEVAHREQNPLWWNNDYRFEWDVDLTGKIKQGKNILALRLNSRHHFAGMFRRPFIYAAR